MKVVLGLGNPGASYDATRHNVGWWVMDHLAHAWDVGPFRREGPALRADGTCADHSVRLLKPLTFMNRSGAALVSLRTVEDFVPARDLLVVVDDAALDVGRVRYRAQGGAGGHNGLKSIEEILGTEEYARLRIGVGTCPPGEDLADWVLAPMPAADEEAVIQLLPDLVGAVEAWVAEGTETAMSRFNR